MKESHLFETAEYVSSQEVDHEPTFNWWVLNVLEKLERIIPLVKQHNDQHLKHTHKFGIKLPTNVQDTYDLDKENGKTVWADSISKEMKNANVEFNILPNGQNAPIGYQQMR